MRKNIENSLDHIEFLVRLLHRSELEHVVAAILIELGIPAKREGYHFIKASILLYDEKSICTINKGLYSAISKQQGGTITIEAVEKAIRNTIKAGWENRSGKMWEYYFPGIDINKKKPPSNHEFIAELARVLDLWKGLRQTYEFKLQRQEVGHGIE